MRMAAVWTKFELPQIAPKKLCSATAAPDKVITAAAAAPDKVITAAAAAPDKVIHLRQLPQTR
jgi:hypothetical protein